MADMEARNKSVLEYLSKSRFVIPLYQRPYTWETEHCEQLWNDIVEFFENKRELKQNDEYFLGPVVVYQQDDRLSIVDGQQRTTTLMLLLKALYTQVARGKGEDKLVDMLESCLWETDSISGEVDYAATHLKSEVATEDDNEVLESILKNTYQKPENPEYKMKKAISNYEKNYLYFLTKSGEYGKTSPTDWQKLCVTILQSCFLLCVECKGDSEDIRLENALRIFNTLNNRGEPLGDSDIFKSIIFGYKNGLEQKKIFAQEWKELEEKSDMNFIFRNYMHIVRARKGIKSNEIGLRPFFTKEHKELLGNDRTLEDLKELSAFWNGEYDESLSNTSCQFYDVLEALPNEYWKYLDSAYFMYCKENGINYFAHTDQFFSRVIANFMVKLINKPTIAEIKPIVFNAYTSLYETGKLDFQTDTRAILQNNDLFKGQFFKADKLMGSLLRLNLYLKYPNQTPDIKKVEIEHIFPRTTQWRKNYTGWDKEEAKPFIESIGNKMLLEKRLNIKAGNGYFDDKKEKYKHSKFLEAQELANLSQNDWLKEDIEARNEEIYKRLKDFFEKNL